MLQFYFLSILLNILAGLIFIYASSDNLSTEKILESDSSFDSDDFNSDDLDLDDLNKTSDFGIESKPEKKFSSAGMNFLKEFAVLNDMTFKLVLGILMVLVGLMKLLSPIQYDVAIVGDLVPALAGLFGGASLLIEYYSSRSEVEVFLPTPLETIFVTGRNYLGIFCIISAVLHFIFPRVLFL